MRATSLPLLCLTVVAGCGPEAAPPADDQADTTSISLGTGETPYRAASADPAGIEEPRDFGTGVLHLGVRPDSVSALREDTVIIRNAPTDEAAVIARWIHRYGGDGTWEYRLETNEEQMMRNDIEWSYEENGLPVDTLAGEGNWARVIHATDRTGAPRFGWVRMSERARIETWPQVLLQQSLFFRRPDSLAFHAAPDGDTVSLEIRTGDTADGLDYSMMPLRTIDDWMQVVVTSPSDYCAEIPAARADTVWIRYLDERGRPRVWYFPRGC